MYLRKIPLVTSPGVGSVLDRVRAGQSRGEGSWMSPLDCAMPHIHPLAQACLFTPQSSCPRLTCSQLGYYTIHHSPPAYSQANLAKKEGKKTLLQETHLLLHLLLAKRYFQ